MISNEDNSEQLLNLAGSVSDGAEIDWVQAEQSTCGGAAQELVHQMRTVDRILQHFARLLQEIAADPARDVGALSVSSPAEQDEVPWSSVVIVNVEPPLKSRVGS